MSEDLGEYINSELYCTNCGRLVLVKMSRFDSGNLTITCPVCDHEHYRYVEKGIITEDRWRSSAGMQTIQATVWVTSSTDSTTATASDIHGFYSQSWLNSSASTTSSTW